MAKIAFSNGDSAIWKEYDTPTPEPAKIKYTLNSNGELVLDFSMYTDGGLKKLKKLEIKNDMIVVRDVEENTTAYLFRDESKARNFRDKLNNSK